jgi:hypothetical protein
MVWAMAMQAGRLRYKRNKDERQAGRLHHNKRTTTRGV